MDPATAIGLAASIITFIDFSAKILKGSAEIYQSASGESKENTQVKNVIDHLNKVTGDISAKKLGIRDEALSALCLQCDELSHDLRRLLKKTQAKLANDKWASLVAAWKGYRRKEDVARLEKRLDKCSQQINMRLSIILYGQQSSVKSQLDDIQKQGLALSNTAGERMQGIRNDLRELLGQVPSTQSSLSGDKLEQLATTLGQLNDVLPRVSKANEVLQRLHFDAIFQREDQISDPSAKTFKWMVDWKIDGEQETSDDSSDAEDTNDEITEYSPSDSPTFGAPSPWDIKQRDEGERQLRRQTSDQFRRFLRESGETYFICGKAGCGKSTFMKYLAANAAVQAELKSWANEAGRELVTVAVFFWRSGTELQRSKGGFLRSLLFNTLRQCPELGEQLFPRDRLTDAFAWRSSNGTPPPFRPAALEWAFEQLADVLENSKYRICYYIDGLDEYEEDNVHHRWLAEQLRSWCRLQNIKVICAARPHTVFREAFQDSGPSIMLQDLTKADIRRFSNNKFQSTLGEPEFEKAREICNVLVEDIVYKANGVFLWAVLVVRSILNACLAHDDNKESLKIRLEEMPPDLESLIERMLEHPDDFTRKRSQTLLLTAIEAYNLNSYANRPLGWTLYTFLEDEDWFLSDSTGIKAQPVSYAQEMLSVSELEKRYARLLQRLHHLTNGLLEITEFEETRIHPDLSSLPYRNHVVSFLHRTVRDYLMKSTKTVPELCKRRIELQKQVWYGRLYLAMTKAASPVQLFMRWYNTIYENGDFIEYLGTERRRLLREGAPDDLDDTIASILFDFRRTLLQRKEEELILDKDNADEEDGLTPLLPTYSVSLPFRRPGDGAEESYDQGENIRISLSFRGVDGTGGQETIKTFKRRFLIWMILSHLWVPGGLSSRCAAIQEEFLEAEDDCSRFLTASLFADDPESSHADEAAIRSFLQLGARPSTELEVKPRGRPRSSNDHLERDTISATIEIWHAVILMFAASCTRKEGEDPRAKAAIRNFELLAQSGADRNVFILAQPDADSTDMDDDPQLYRVELADLIDASNRIDDNIAKLLFAKEGQNNRQSWWQQAKILASLSRWSSTGRESQDTVAIERLKYELLPSSTLEQMLWRPRGLVSRRGTLVQGFQIRLT